MERGSGVVEAADVALGDAMRDCGSSTAVAALVDASSLPPSARSTQEWLALVAHCQEVVNVATAAQDAAIARLAAIEREDAEDGTVVDVPRALGHLALDAPDLVSGVLPISHPYAESRVRLAIRCAADAPGADSLGASTGLGGLHEAMATGVLDGYRASIVAEELEAAPAEVASAVVLALEPHLATDVPAALRQRCRRVLAQISPDLLRQRARRAREDCGLRRWPEEPGVDRWNGTFPSEDAAVAWAAIDALAQRYVADGTCAPIERARAKALTDLVAGQATVEVTVGLTVPEGEVRAEDEAATAGGGTSAGSGATGAGPGADPAGRADAAGRADPCGPADPDGPADADGPDDVGGPADPDGRGEGAGIDGCAPCDDVSAPAGPAGSGFAPAPCPRFASAPVRSAGDADDLLEVGGLLPGDPVLVSGAWMRRLLRQASATQAEVARRRGRGRPRSRIRPAVVLRACDPQTGALVDVRNVIEDGYRPSARLAAFVRARDRRCRFPGCSVAARFCDLDHVRPWPTGPTSAANLMCVCRRHHRIKQRPGWRVRLALDGTVTWVDPAGTIRVTYPVDALHGLVLPGGGSWAEASVEPGVGDLCPGDRVPAGNGGAPEERSHRAPGPWNDEGPHSALEFRLEHVGAGSVRDDAFVTRRRLRRRGVRVEIVPLRRPVVVDPVNERHGRWRLSSWRGHVGPPPRRTPMTARRDETPTKDPPF